MTLDLPPGPQSGRIYRRRRRIRLSDTTVEGRFRLDAAARYLQDIASDDVEDAGIEDSHHAWVVRRTVMDVVLPSTHDRFIDVATWASGVGPRWAARRTYLHGDAGGRIEAETLWIHVDRLTLGLAPLPPEFTEVYGEAVDGRRVSARLTLPVRPPEGAETIVWPLRITDIDILGHVNNAAYWAAIEDVIAAHGLSVGSWHAVMEYRDAIDMCPHLALRVALSSSGFNVWFVVNDTIAAVAAVEARTGAGT